MGSLLTASPTNTVLQKDQTEELRGPVPRTSVVLPRPRVNKMPRYIIGGAGNYRVPTFR